MKKMVVFILSLYSLSLLAEDTAIYQKIRSVFSDQNNVNIRPYNSTLLEIEVGEKIYFASSNGQYIFAGPIIDTESRKDLLKEKLDQKRQKTLSKATPDSFLTFPASSDRQHKITMFTDIDCPYCRKTHQFMGEFNQAGIEVNYVVIPRGGPDSKGFNRVVSILCSADPREAITQVMGGSELKEQQCEHSLIKHAQLAHSLGIASTPATVLADGSLHMGLMTPARLQKLLQSQSGSTPVSE